MTNEFKINLLLVIQNLDSKEVPELSFIPKAASPEGVLSLSHLKAIDLVLV